MQFVIRDNVFTVSSIKLNILSPSRQDCVESWRIKLLSVKNQPHGTLEADLSSENSRRRAWAHEHARS